MQRAFLATRAQGTTSTEGSITVKTRLYSLGPPSACSQTQRYSAGRTFLGLIMDMGACCAIEFFSFGILETRCCIDVALAASASNLNRGLVLQGCIMQLVKDGKH